MGLKARNNQLRPIAISMSKLMNLHNKTLEEAEEVILLAIESFELNNGRSINYLIALLEDWEEKELYSAEDIRKYRRDYKRGYTDEMINEIESVPMINWLKDLQK
ncbi:DnaD domain protein [Aerococcaceae bacterium DSM 111021]|nr:DnaD domain protein [Aerococcaceae bacterium DSM 111021]